MCNIALLNIYSLDSGETADFLQHNLHISTHPVYNHKTITVNSLFLHRVKNKTILQAYFFPVSIQINLYIFCLFLNIICRQNILTNHQQNMQHPKHKVSDSYWSRIDFFFPLCCFSRVRDVVAQIVISWQHMFDYTVNSPYTTIDTHCCTISLLWFFFQHSHAQTSDNINIQSL